MSLGEWVCCWCKLSKTLLSPCSHQFVEDLLEILTIHFSLKKFRGSLVSLVATELSSCHLFWVFSLPANTAQMLAQIWATKTIQLSMFLPGVSIQRNSKCPKMESGPRQQGVDVRWCLKWIPVCQPVELGMECTEGPGSFVGSHFLLFLALGRYVGQNFFSQE